MANITPIKDGDLIRGSNQTINNNFTSLNTALDGKVDKVTGKGLSTNDYTTAEKNKLAGIQAGAQVNAVTSVAGKTGAVMLTNSDVDLANVDAPDTGQVQIGFGAAANSSGPNCIAIGKNAEADMSGTAVGENAYAAYGGAVGSGTSSSGGGAVGKNAQTTNGGAIGVDAESTTGGAVGESAKSEGGGAIGSDAKTSSGFAGGAQAKTINASGAGIDAIQLGTGTNSTANTFQVYSYQLLDANGKIPADRVTQSGTWTPKIVSSTASAPTITYNKQTGDWIRIGNMVWCTYTIWMASYSKGSADGSIVLGGLPFTPYGDLGRILQSTTYTAYLNVAGGVTAYEFLQKETNGIALIKRSAGGGGLYCKYASDGSIFNNNTEFAGVVCFRI